jgi:glycosyltransferase involved in cell wall biosynthesis
MRRLIFLYSHPIQYFAPLSRLAQEDGAFDVWTLYCSPQGIEALRDVEFEQAIQWDIPLLEGYRSVFFRNWRGAYRPVGSFWSLVNPGVLTWLWKQPKGVLIVHGWGHFTHVLALVAGKMLGYRIGLRGESNWRHEQQLPRWKRQLKRWLLGQGLFRFVDVFLYIGEENRQFYLHMGVPEHRLAFAPYGVDNARFSSQWARLKAEDRTGLRRRLGLPEDALVVLFSGKLIPKKRPLDLLEAFHRASVPSAVLVYVGEGVLRTTIEARAQALGIADVVYLTGFVNQSAIGQYYAAADVFVMCSDIGETWGLSTNEAMNFALPVLLSDLTGCAADLCQPGVNGLVFPTGDIEALAARLRYLLTLPPERRKAMGEASRAIVARYSYDVVLENLKRALLYA